MKVFLRVWILLSCALLPAGAVRVADTIGDAAVRQAAIACVLSGRKADVEQISMSVPEALAALKAGKADLALIRKCELPAARQEDGKIYAIETAMVSVHRDNPRNSCSSQELAEIFSGWKKSWVTLNGESFRIHLMRQMPDSVPVRLFCRKILKQRTLAAAFERQDFMEILRLVSVNRHAAALTARPDMEIPTDIKVISVDGVYPSLDHLRAGTYPLCERRMVLSGRRLSSEAEAFLSFILSGDMAVILAEEGLLQP